MILRCTQSESWTITLLTVVLPFLLPLIVVQRAKNQELERTTTLRLLRPDEALYPLSGELQTTNTSSLHKSSNGCSVHTVTLKGVKSCCVLISWNSLYFTPYHRNDIERGKRNQIKMICRTPTNNRKLSYK